jgi:hypothetical protein
MKVVMKKSIEWNTEQEMKKGKAVYLMIEGEEDIESVP